MHRATHWLSALVSIFGVLGTAACVASIFQWFGVLTVKTWVDQKGRVWGTTEHAIGLYRGTYFDLHSIASPEPDLPVTLTLHIQETRGPISPQASPLSTRWGFSNVEARRVGRRLTMYGSGQRSVPLWPIPVACCVPVLLRAVSRRRHRPPNPQATRWPGSSTFCYECGYDLRESVSRCPECGAPARGPNWPNRPDGGSRRT